MATSSFDKFTEGVSREVQISKGLVGLDLIKRLEQLNTQRFRQLLGGYEDFVNFYLITNEADLVKQMQEYVGPQAMYRETIKQAQTAFLPQVVPILEEIILDIAEAQDPNAFPSEYIRPLFDGLQALNLVLADNTVKGLQPHLVTFEVPNLQIWLGGYDEYEVAFHHGAEKKAVRTGKFTFEVPRVDIRQGPVSESELRQPDAKMRYRYWKALFEGQGSFNVQSPHGGSQSVQLVGSRAETIQARLDAWRAVSPTGFPTAQWILLENGQNRWAPTIKVSGGLSFKTKVSPHSTVSSILEQEGGFATQALKNATKGFNAEYIVPGNISGKWIDALSVEWTNAIITAWNTQILRYANVATPRDTLLAQSKLPQIFIPRTRKYQEIIRGGQPVDVWRDLQGRFTSRY